MKILLAGANGRLGTKIVELAQQQKEVTVTALTREQPLTATSFDEYDVLLDVTTASATLGLVKQAAAARLPIVIGTTGHSELERKTILAAAQNDHSSGQATSQ